MKILVEPSKSKASPMRYEDALPLIHSIYGSDIAIEFDDSCVSSITYLIENEKISGARITYNKMKIIHNGHTIYWPVQQKFQDIEKGNANEMDFYSKYKL